MDIHRAYRAPSDRLHSSIPGGEQQRHPEVLSDAEAKDQLWSISQRYDSLLKLQRDFADAQRAYFDAEGDRFKAEAEALTTDEGATVERWLRAQKLEREAKLQVLQRRVLLLQSLKELRQIQLQDLAGHIQPVAAQVTSMVWQDDRPQRHPQSPGSAKSEPSEPDAEAGPFPGLVLAATRAELEALQQRERELMAAKSPGVELCERLAVSEQNLATLMHQTASAKRLAESIAWKHLTAESEAQQATVAADLLQAAMEVQHEEMAGIQPGSRAASVAVPAESAPTPCQPEAPRNPRPGHLAPELLSLVMEEVGFASEQLAALSPWRSEVSGAGEETPSTRVQSLSEVDIPQSFQAGVSRSEMAPVSLVVQPESTVSTSSPCGIPAMALAEHDGIDLALASFLSPRRNRLRRSLFSREGRGLYRYGTCRLQLRFAQGELEASGRDVEAEAWEPLEDFLRKVEVDQSQRLQRARERAKALRKP